jgi:hypothetical protein
MLLELRDWLLLRVPWLVAGENFWAGTLPEKTVSGADIPTRVLVLLEVPSATEPDLKDRFDAKLQVWNRAEDYFDAEQDALSIYEQLHSNEWLDLPVRISGQAFRIWTSEAEGRPRPVESPDARKHYTFVTDYILRIASQ